MEMKPKDTYVFHSKHGWYTAAKHANIHTAEEAIAEAERLRRQFKEPTLKAYKAHTTYREIKKGVAK